MASQRLIAIGDIHGYRDALRALLDAVRIQPDDTVVTLGDYVDRGPDSRGVFDELIALADHCELVPLRGNHDELFLEICCGATVLMDDWLRFGGDTTVASYGGDLATGVPREHLDFLHACPSIHEADAFFFVHGSYTADVPLNRQMPEVLHWESLRMRLPGPHGSGKTAIVGHTAQKDGEILDLGYLKCIDTFCYGGGWLTALDVPSGQVWQVDQNGTLRPEA